MNAFGLLENGSIEGLLTDTLDNPEGNGDAAPPPVVQSPFR